jgi:hypothetical protein
MRGFINITLNNQRKLLGATDSILAYCFRIVLISVTVLALVLLLYAHRFYFQDDAFISLRYVSNFLEHGELTWNLGERLEGFTNFLFVILSAVLQFFGVEPILSTRVINFAALTFIVALFVPLMRTMVSVDAALIGWALVTSALPLLAWVWGGLEGPLFAAIVFGLHACVLLHFADAGNRLLVPLCGVIAAMAFITRPDGAIFGAIACAAILAAPGSWRDGLKKSLIFAVYCFPIVLGFLAFRYSYYGSLVPNSFHVKGTVNFSAGFGYLLNSTIRPPFLPVLSLIGFVLAWRSGRVKEAAFVGTGIVAYALYVASVGGDHMEYSRLLLPIIPLCAMLVALGFGEMLFKHKRPYYPMAAVSVLLILQLFVLPEKKWDGATLIGTVVGHHIAKHWPSDALIALNTAGSTPYFNQDKRFIDMLGLNDAVIARRKIASYRLPRQRWPGHAKGDGVYVLSRRPDYIILSAGNGRDASDPWFLTDIELAENKEFQKCYEKYEVDMRKFADAAELEKLFGLLFRGDSTMRPVWERTVKSDHAFFKFIYYQHRSGAECQNRDTG